MQAYVALDADAPVEEVHGYARRLAERLEKAHPKLIVSRMDKRVRRNKVLIDWSQNSAAKTTVAPYSLRGSDAPTVSMPVTWDEVELTATKANQLRFELTEALARVETDGDLLEDLLAEAYPIPSSN
jgi:bifunctional non-homologous end joining protein LigD